MVDQTKKIHPWPFIGHDELGQHLIKLSEANHLPQVMLFVGPRAVGKSSAARWLTSHGLCTSTGLRPCGECPSCRQISLGQHPDSKIIDPPTGATIGIEEVRLVFKEYQMKSWNSIVRWLVIVDAERMTEAAANTMLKFLEDIPKLVNVILTSSQPQDLLPTVKSRASVYQWHLISAVEVRKIVGPDQRYVSRAAGRPGWASDLLVGKYSNYDADEANTLIHQVLSSSNTKLGPANDRKVIEHKLNQEELVVRDLLLRSVDSGQRLLWPVFSALPELLPETMLMLASKYLERYIWSPNIQPRLLYEDFHLA